MSNFEQQVPTVNPVVVNVVENFVSAMDLVALHEIEGFTR
jgi:hypothetical protein